jgi:hypothetical protein
VLLVVGGFHFDRLVEFVFVRLDLIVDGGGRFRGDEVFEGYQAAFVGVFFRRGRSAGAELADFMLGWYW